MRFPATPGHNVQTSLDLRYQLAASHAVSSAATSKPVDMVVLQPSTGRILAVIERPGGFDRVLQGIFPPGSTFKIVTASALTKKGLRPSTTVQCPATANIGGRTFHNFDNEHLGSTSLLNAFACWMQSDDDTRARSMLAGVHPILETPFALDAARVAKSGRAPLLSTGMVSADGRGLLGRGLCALPLECFASSIGR